MNINGRLAKLETAASINQRERRTFFVTVRDKHAEVDQEVAFKAFGDRPRPDDIVFVTSYEKHPILPDVEPVAMRSMSIGTARR